LSSNSENFEKIKELEEEFLGKNELRDYQNLIKEIEKLKEDGKQHTIFTLFGDKKGIYMNIINVCFQYSVFTASVLFYTINLGGIASLLQSYGLIDLLAKIGGIGGSIIYGTASLMWLKRRKREYLKRRAEFEINFNYKDKRLYFPWEIEGSKAYKIVNFYKKISRYFLK
jgi:hypothetical protein